MKTRENLSARWITLSRRHGRLTDLFLREQDEEWESLGRDLAETERWRCRTQRFLHLLAVIGERLRAAREDYRRELERPHTIACENPNEPGRESLGPACVCAHAWLDHKFIESVIAGEAALLVCAIAGCSCTNYQNRARASRRRARVSRCPRRSLRR